MSAILEYAMQRFDLLNYVQSHGAEMARANEWVLHCPYCGKQKLTVNLLKKAWHCWVCQQYRNLNGKREAIFGAGGLIDLVQLLEGCNRKTAVDIILSAAFTRPSDLETIQREELLRQHAELATTSMTIEPPPGSRPIEGDLLYLGYRGITPADVKLFGLFWCDSGRYENRLVFPVFEDGRLVYFQARAMWEPEPGDKRFRKVLNPSSRPGMAVSTEVLMNLDIARQYSRVVITEGPMDCVRAGPDAVCTFGKSISGVQIAKLAHAGVRAIDLMWDADAKNDAIRAAHILSSLFDTRVVFLPNGDPADHTREELYEYRFRSTRIDDNRLAVVS